MHCFRTAAALYLSPILRAFNDAYPEVTLDVTLDDTVVNIVAEGYDVAIRIGEVIDKDLIAVKLGPDLRQSAVASPDYLARGGTPTHPRDLLAHSCIGWRWPGQASPYKWELMADGKWFEVAVEGPVITSQKDFGVQAAVDGLGIAFASEQLIDAHIAEGASSRCSKLGQLPFPATTCVIQRSGRWRRRSARLSRPSAGAREVSQRRRARERDGPLARPASSRMRAVAAALGLVRPPRGRRSRHLPRRRRQNVR